MLLIQPTLQHYLPPSLGIFDGIAEQILQTVLQQLGIQSHRHIRRQSGLPPYLFGGSHLAVHLQSGQQPCLQKQGMAA